MRTPEKLALTAIVLGSGMVGGSSLDSAQTHIQNCNQNPPGLATSEGIKSISNTLTGGFAPDIPGLRFTVAATISHTASDEIFLPTCSVVVLSAPEGMEA